MDVASHVTYDPGVAALVVPAHTIVRLAEFLQQEAAGSLVDRDV